MAQRFRQWPEFGTSGRVYRRIDTQREDVDFKGRTISHSRLSRAGLGDLRGGDLVEVIGCTLSVSGCRKDGTVVSFKNF
jgi:hypothetical protein